MSSRNRTGSELEQEQFLTVLSRDEAVRRFTAALRPAPIGVEEVALDRLSGRVLAHDIAAPIDTPPFDRSLVDGFALRAADIERAADARPVSLRLNPETIACGVAPEIAVTQGTATPIATGGPIPRGADAVVMIEQTDLDDESRLLVRRSSQPGRNIGFAGSDIARGETLLRKGVVIGAREIGMLAAVGLARAPVWRKPRVAVISTGDELVEPGKPLRAAGIYDSNGPIITSALAENGCEPVRLGAVPDDEALLTESIRSAFETFDAVILSGGTSKGAGDLTYRIIGSLGAPGVVAHGVALKPGKPLCLAVCDGKPVVVLPGFPTSAMFTFHHIVAPVLRVMAGLPATEEAQVTAQVPVRIPSEFGRTEFVMVALSEGAQGRVAYPIGKGSGAVTAFSQADGFLTIDALAESMPAGSQTEVTLFAPSIRIADLSIMGSHCVGLDAVISILAERGVSARSLALGSLGGLAALRRGECDIAPFHLLDEKSGVYNQPFLSDAMTLIPGWRRMQGVLFRRDDERLASTGDARRAVEAALADPDSIMVNRNLGAGTRILIDQLLASRTPPGYSNQPRSHNAVAASISQRRADWGVAIKPVADASGLGFYPLAEEHYDFAVSATPRSQAMIDAFGQAVRGAGPALIAIGFAPA